MGDVADCLPEFLAALGYEYHVPRLLHLFPYCIWLPGWHHDWDNIALKTYNQLKFWPSFLRRLKSLTRFCRFDAYREVLHDACAEAGYDAARLRRKPPRFAAWRWSTLCMVCKYWLPLLLRLAEIWHRRRLGKIQMLTLEFEARNAVTSAGWVEDFRIVYDLMQKIHVRRSWGSGCSCCDERRKRGESVECHRQGKRLREVVDYIDDFDFIAAY